MLRTSAGGTLFGAALALSALPATAQVRIEQVYASGGAVGALYSRDFVQLYNAGAPQSLSGWSLQHASASGASWTKAALPALTLAQGERLLVRLAGEASVPPNQSCALPLHDADHPAQLAPSGGKLAVCSNNITLSGGQPTSPAIADFVGWGDANWREPFAGGSSADNAPALSATLALLRRSCGELDAQRNAGDFQLALPRPRSRALDSNSGIDFATYVAPRMARAGESVRVCAAPFDCALESAAGDWQFTLDAGALGAGFVVLRDDGTGGDELAGDGLYSAAVAIGAATAIGDVALPVTAQRGAASSQGVASLLVRSAASDAADLCASAELVTGPFPLSRSGSLSGASVEPNAVLHALFPTFGMGARRGRWLRVLGTGGPMSADTCLSAPLGGVDTPDTVLLVATGDCDSLSVIGFGDDQLLLCGPGFGVERRSRVEWCSLAGQEYFVWTASFNSGASTLDYVLTISELGGACSTPVVGGALCTPDAAAASAREAESALGPASNDLCGAAAQPEPISVGSPERALVGHARALGAHIDVDLYRFRAAISDTFRARLDAPFRARLELYELGPGGSCPLGALVASTALAERCSQPSLIAPLQAGGWYALRVAPANSDDPNWLGGFEPGGNSSAYVLWTELGDPPANDDCSSALALSCGASANGTLWGATGDVGALAACAGPGGAVAVEHPGVWWRVSLPGAPGVDDRSVWVETDSVAVDTRLSVFAGDCAQLVCVTSNDDIDASGRSRVAWRAVAGVEYFVLVHGGEAAQGAFVIRAGCEFPTPGDECASAPTLSGFSGAVLVTTLGATGEPSNYPAAGVGGLAPCASPALASNSYFDVWRAFAPACSGQVLISACGAGDFVLTLHSDCPTPTLPATALCAVTSASGCAQLVAPLDSSRLYWVRVAHADGASPGGPVTLSWAFEDGDGDGAADCVDGCPSDPNKTAPGVCGCGVSDVDSDGDGASDCVDGCPIDPNKLAPGVCGCGVSDIDTDGDGAADCVDGCPLDPNKLLPGICGCGVSDVDSDGDGVANCLDGCPSDPNKLAPGICGCGVSDVDSDGDGAADCVDGCASDPNKTTPGVCGCGVSDVDSDGDGAADCVDGCPSDPNKLAPGACGCGVSDFDTDGDGVADCVDNCVALSNPTQADCDLDGVGDACEIASGASYDTDGDGVPDECESGQWTGYCTASTSSAGCSPSLSGLGTPSASLATPFSIVAEPIDAQRFGLVFYGVTGPAASPFGTGWLCVNLPIQRTPVAPTGGPAGTCLGQLLLDWNGYVLTHPQALGMPLQAGDLIWSQAWWRDPQAPSGTRVSSALQFTLAP